MDDDKFCDPLPISKMPDISRTIRDLPPAHFLFKVDSYSSVSERDEEKHESPVFEVGGLRWKLCLYPKGNRGNDGNGHISLYLRIVDTEIFPRGWEVYVNFKFFVFDQIRDKYLTIQDGEGTARCFQDMKPEWGISHLLPLESFHDISNGYLVDDSCIFGAEIFIIRSTCKWEIIQQPIDFTFTWKMEKFSSFERETYYSEPFSVAGRKWKLLVYPKGCGKEKGKGFSVFLSLHDVESPNDKKKCFVEFKLRVKDQVQGFHEARSTKQVFTKLNKNWGFHKLLPLEDLTETYGFIVDDTVIVEVDVISVSLINIY